MSSSSLLLVAPLFALVGCGGSASCPSLSVDMHGLLAQASSIEVAVYDATATCDGDDVAAGAPAPLVDRHADGNGGTVVELPAGHYVVVVHAFDAAGALLGSACQAELFTPGQKACVAVTLDPVAGDGGAPDDLAGGGGSADLLPAPDLGTPPFVAQTSGVTTDLYEAWSPGGGAVFVVGVNGVILHSVDSGATWTRQTSGTTQKLESVWGSSASDVYAVGTGATLLHTTNGGASWQAVTVPESPTIGLYDVWGSGPADIYITGDKGQVLHGSGTTWSVVNIGAVSTYVNDVWGSSATDVYLFGGNGLVMHGSASGGFTKQNAGTTATLYYGWGTAGGNDVWINAVSPGSSTVPPMTTVYHTADHGATWVGQVSTSAQLWAIWSTPGGDAFAVGDQILETTDRGAHWTSVLATPPQLLLGVGGDGATGAVWAVGTAGTILYRP